MYNKVMETVDFLNEVVKYRPKIAIVLGSGLGDLVDYIDEKVEIEYKDIPNFAISTVSGHAGKLVFGKIDGVEVVAMKGRFHFYEGYSMKEVTYPMYVMKVFGVEKLIVSNAAGGCNETYEPGTLMLIKDHINNFGTNPLIGRNDERFGPRFPDMTDTYKVELRDIAKEVAQDLGIKYREGVYVGNTGPTYETGAEVRACINMGGDAVGMSTVPEVTVANYLGIKVLGISCITNMATGIAVKAHSHEDVVKVAEEAGANFCKWIVNIIKKIK